MTDITNVVSVSKSRLFRIDKSAPDEFWFILAGIGVTTGGHFTGKDIAALRDLCMKALGDYE